MARPDELEAERLGPEGQGAILVVDLEHDLVNAPDHRVSPSGWWLWIRMVVLDREARLRTDSPTNPVSASGMTWKPANHVEASSRA
jgi:hypothetical protein